MKEEVQVKEEPVKEEPVNVKEEVQVKEEPVRVKEEVQVKEEPVQGNEEVQTKEEPVQVKEEVKEEPTQAEEALQTENHNTPTTPQLPAELASLTVLASLSLHSRSTLWCWSRPRTHALPKNSPRWQIDPTTLLKLLSTFQRRRSAR